ncbi:MAG: hypothetical protein J7K68_00585 [Candidatus Diapherotrites archaeon]|nr:hypothetical protein [Candidatus Diapherotrites archaeon]
MPKEVPRHLIAKIERKGQKAEKKVRRPIPQKKEKTAIGVPQRAIAIDADKLNEIVELQFRKFRIDLPENASDRKIREAAYPLDEIRGIKEKI